MPPRKSTSATPADSEETQDLPQTQSQTVTATEQQLKARAEGGVSVEDYLLPRSLTLRLAKSVLPPNTAIQKDAVLAIQKAATVFVSYLSSHANEATLKRTVAPSDVFSALSDIEFDSFRERLEKELDAHTEQKAGKRRSKKSGDGVAGVGGEGSAEVGENTAHGAKRVKRVSGEQEGLNRGNEAEEEDGDETQDEPEMMNEVEEDGDEEEDEEEGEEEEEQEEEEEEDINRVEDLDGDSRSKGMMDPDGGSDNSDSEGESGPSAQLMKDVGFG